MLSFNKVSKSFSGPDGRVAAVDQVSFSITKGEFVVVQGPSGSGKTTLLLMAGALLSPTEGQVLVDGQDPYGLSNVKRSRLRADRIGFVFQQFHLIPYLTVLDNILVAAGPHQSAEAKTRAKELISHFQLEARANHVPAQLSTGERQRTALARALLNRPGLLLADEPTGNLDEENAQAVLGYLKEFAGNGGAVLMVSHDTRAAAITPKILTMTAGTLV